MPSAFLSTHALPLTRPIDYTLSSLPPSQWAGWKNAVFLWMKLRQRLVPLRVSWLVDRGRITPHHRNWRQRGLGEGIARSPPELCYTEAIERAKTAELRRNVALQEEQDIVFSRTGFARDPGIHWELELRFQRALQDFSWMVAWRIVRFAIFYGFRKSVLCIFIYSLTLGESKMTSFAVRECFRHEGRVLLMRVFYMTVYVVSVCLRSTQICVELPNGDSQPGARLTPQDPGDTYTYLICL